MMWDCGRCGCRAIAGDLRACPQCLTAKEEAMPKITSGGASNAWEPATGGVVSASDDMVTAGEGSPAPLVLPPGEPAAPPPAAAAPPKRAAAPPRAAAPATPPPAADDAVPPPPAPAESPSAPPGDAGA